ncbi:low temperature requirement protein A [Cryptosporangium aurantiacum]|uniref:Low temperature requirement protein LtrA n=1 Tax=Cryptosporangium aurantiacum TaxID=134849 RepID=A0A1M7RMR9_9ACTN|nr:low temperature requirement protein A [Cryptosporangium aurantiacum]SHN47388.1 Low temperature requirement protein LtrA [Cryptosporangium aurantiacum]
MTTTPPDRARAGRPWRSPVVGRDPNETHRASTPLELLFDLCFVVAVASAAAELHHAVAEAHFGLEILSYLMVFFAIWWAWMNFTWYASAYDVDDVPHRLLTLVSIAGVLVLAAGVPQAFEHGDFGVVTLGYVIMRLGMIGHWLRVAADSPTFRRTALRYVAGLTVVQVGWILRLLLPDPWGLVALPVLVAAELVVPVWAERTGETTWHPGHIAERYGLFTLLVLGEGILGATITVQSAISENGVSASLLCIAAAGLLVIFGLWWSYFKRPAEIGLRISPRASFRWGYAHYVVFAALAAVGAGIQVVADTDAHHAHLGPVGAAFALAVPVAAVLVTIGLLQSWLDPSRSYLLRFSGAALLVLLAAATTWLGVPLAAAVLLEAAAVCALIGVDLLDARRLVAAPAETI